MENIAASILDMGGPELFHAVMDELKTGIELQRMQTEARVQTWSQSPTRTHRGVDGLGYCEMEVPADVYFNWQHYETGFWQDNASRKWFLNKNPQFRVKYEPKPQKGWTAPLEKTGSGLYIGTKYGRVERPALPEAKLSETRSSSPSPQLITA